MNSFTTFITPEELFEFLNNPQLVIIDCRFDLANPDWGAQDYLLAHIPNAIYADLDKDLSGIVNENTGRHPLPEPGNFIETCSKWGIDDTKQVIVYDTTSGSYAARLWWMLKYYGHQDVAILDGGFSAWLEIGFPQAQGSVSRQPSTFLGSPNIGLLVTTSKMENLINQTDYAIIDARSSERYTGWEEPIDKKAGHIPHAVNFFHANNLNSKGRLLPVKQLLKMYTDLLKQQGDPSSIVLYCGSGVTSCLNFAVLQHLGIKSIQLYLGSWSEWIREPEHPIISEVNP